MMSGPRPRRLVLLTLLDESDVAGAACGAAAGGAAVELLDGPDVWSSGAASGSGGRASMGSSISTSGMSLADALPDGSVPTGIRASRGCLSVSLGTVAGIRHVSSYMCDACPLGVG